MATIRMFGERQFLLCSCDRCHLEFWVPVAFEGPRRRDGRRLWCPAGHANAFGDSEGVRVLKEVERLKGVVMSRSMEVSEAKGSVRSLKGWVTRLKRRLEGQKD